MKLNSYLNTITVSTKFVLGKYANKLYLLTTSTPVSTERDFGLNTNNNKSIYTKYPHLFKYESDQTDKQWLFENSIIDKKMVRLYIFLYNDLVDLFSSATFNENESDSEYESDEAVSLDGNEKSERVEFIHKKLKPFNLPQSMIHKIKKQYFNFKKKNNE
jgi:hypothetical protein